VTFHTTLMKSLLTTTKLTSLNNTKSLFFGNGGHHLGAFGNNICFLITRSPWSQLMLQLHLFLPQLDLCNKLWMGQMSSSWTWMGFTHSTHVWNFIL
jgi:hypothetical protein